MIHHNNTSLKRNSVVNHIQEPTQMILIRVSDQLDIDTFANSLDFPKN